MTELDNRIHNYDLSQEMAYAEKPYRELAVEAQRLGAVSEQDLLLSRAEQEGIASGRQYLGKLMAALEQDSRLSTPDAKPNRISLEIPTLDDAGVSKELLSKVIFSKEDMVQYADHAYTADFRIRKVAGRAWSLVQDFASGSYGWDDKRFFRRHPLPLVKTRVQTYDDYRDNLNFGGLVDLIKEYQTIKAADPSRKETEILGPDMGATTTSFVVGFANHKLSDLRTNGQ